MAKRAFFVTIWTRSSKAGDWMTVEFTRANKRTSDNWVQKWDITLLGLCGPSGVRQEAIWCSWRFFCSKSTQICKAAVSYSSFQLGISAFLGCYFNGYNDKRLWHFECFGLPRASYLRKMNWTFYNIRLVVTSGKFWNVWLQYLRFMHS